MNALHRIRLLNRPLAGWLVALFLCTLGFMSAPAPSQPGGNVQWLCTASGSVQIVVHDADGASHGVGHGLHCPLCAGAGAPQPSAPGLVRHFTVSREPAAPSRPARPILAAAPPLPARGPPTSA